MRLSLAFVAILLALGLAGCGIRGPLEKPEEAKAADQAASGDTKVADPKAAKAPETPHKPFALDPLIR